MSGRIWWRPDPDGDTATVAVEWSEITEPMIVEVGGYAESISGRGVQTTLSRRLAFTVSAEGITDQLIFRKLRSFSEHAARNGQFALALDEDKAWAGSLDVALNPGDTSVYAIDHPLLQTWAPDQSPAAALAADDLLWIGRPSPDRTSDLTKVTAFTRAKGGTLVTVSQVLAQFAVGALVRHEGYYPALRLDRASAGKSLLTSHNRIDWSFDLPCIEDLVCESGLSDGGEAPPIQIDQQPIQRPGGWG